MFRSLLRSGSSRTARSAIAAQADAARDIGEWADAARLYRDYINQNPADFGIWVQLGHCLKEAGDLDGALDAYQSARNIRHLDPDLLLSLGHLFKLRQAPSHAYSYYKLSYEIDGNRHALTELLRAPAAIASNLASVDGIAALPLTDADLTPANVATIRSEIEESGLFDRDWYLKSYLDDKDESDPLQYFIEQGILQGHDPSEHFSSKGYVIANPDIAGSGVNPFLHFLWVGRKEARPLVLLPHDATERLLAGLPDLFALRQRIKRGRIAVVVHVFYPEIWDEIKELLPNIAEPFDLYVSLVKGVSEHYRDTILTDYADAHIITFPNHGRDCFPFTEFLRAGALEGYELVCKLHTKRSLHREDGDLWRNDLYQGLLGSKSIVEIICREMRENPDVGAFVPDDYIFSTEYLGSNTVKLQKMLDKVNLNFDINAIRFPSGNMFWINGACLQYLKSLKLDYSDYELEGKQLDGTTAHAVERFIGIACEASGQRVVSMRDIKSRKVAPYTGDRHRLIAFYLPQFHPIPENDAWWGKNFTEWLNLQKGKPVYHGHNQPRLPSDLGYYDLRLDDIRTQQSELARTHGVDGFCYYHYWFDGRTLLDMPLNRLIASPELDQPFCICWANENWTRSWDGRNRDVLLAQTYDPTILKTYASDVAHYLRDSRYIRHQGKPLFLIYKIKDIPDVETCVREWREVWRREGVGEVHVAAVRTFPKDPARHPQDLGLDAYVDFPPQSLALFAEGASVQFTQEFHGLIYDYQKAVRRDLIRYETEDSSFVHRGVMGCWDNSARRGVNAHIAHGASPITYRAWLRKMMIQDAAANPSGERLLFINAWNEWAEGTYLEPDQRYGYAFLEATKSVRPLSRKKGKET